MITLAIDVVLLLGVLFWLALGVWTYRDASRRIANPWLVALATGIGLFPPYLGPLVYMLFRPPEYLDDRHERELEIRAMEARLRHEQRCPVCRTEIDDAWIACPVCTTKLRHACSSCQAPLEPLWQVCPYCQTPISDYTPAPWPSSAR